jgi:secondary thiamine-phosphate synthase enzyme
MLPLIKRKTSDSMVRHFEFTLPAYSRGFHLITTRVLQEIGSLPEQGLFHLFIKHTSAGLTINENADPSVLVDFEQIFNRIVPENLPFLTHTLEGPDDMPAHIKAALVGSSVTAPIVNGGLALGIWQGIYLCEFRNQARPRTLVATIYE